MERGAWQGAAGRVDPDQQGGWGHEELTTLSL
jgi:hypothetical protein